MARVKPRLIALEVGGSDVSDEVSDMHIDSAESDSDFLTYEEGRSGGSRDYTLTMTIAQDHSAGSLYRLILDNVGEEVDGQYAPYGNATATADQPFLEFTAVVAEPDGTFFGGPATSSTSAVATVEVTWKLTGRPTEVTTGSYEGS